MVKNRIREPRRHDVFAIRQLDVEEIFLNTKYIKQKLFYKK